MHGNDFASLSAAIEARRDELVELTRTGAASMAGGRPT
jgi:hypothetical protein